MHDCWDHFTKAFSNNDTAEVLKDYDEGAVIRMSNVVSFTGRARVIAYYERFCSYLNDTSDVDIVVAYVEEADDDHAGRVTWVWSASASDILRATDTYIFNSEGMITRHDVDIQWHFNGCMPCQDK